MDPKRSTTLLALMLAAWPAGVGAFTCPRPAYHVLLHPAPGATGVARNAVVYLRGPRWPTLAKGLHLRDAASGTRVAAMLRGDRKSHMVRLIPVKALAAGRRFEVMLDRRRKAGAFSTGQALAPTGAPRPERARVRFWPPPRGVLPAGYPRVSNATVRLAPAAGAKGPAAVVLEAQICWHGRRRVKACARARLPYKRADPVRINAVCSSHLPRGAPRAGRHYRITLVPWSAAGGRGKAVLLQGTIRHQPRPSKR